MMDRYTSAGRRRKRILAVDDSGPMLRNIMNWLKDDYDVALANSSFKAIRSICNNRPDLVLLDYEMPICDGPRLLQMMRAEDDYENLPVIFLTGKNHRNDITQILSFYPAGYILKSGGAESVKSTVHRFFHPDDDIEAILAAHKL